MTTAPPFDPIELYGKAEPLRPDLWAHVSTLPGLGRILKHPLCYQVGGFDPERAAYVNHRVAFLEAEVAKRIAKGDYAGAVWLYERPYRVDIFVLHAARMTDADYWHNLGHLWSDTENAWQNLPKWKRLFRSRRPGRAGLMDASERRALGRLPANVTVWRGCEPRNRRGISWTLDRDKAAWFATRFAHRGAARLLIEGTVGRSDVLAVLLGRGEREVVSLAVRPTGEQKI